MEKKQVIDVMIDLESLGLMEGSTPPTVFQIAASAFDISTGEVFNEFDKTSNISVDKEIVATGSTLRWWSDQGTLFNQLLMRNTTDFSSDCLIKSFHEWLMSLVEKYGINNVRVFGNGISFDLKIVTAHFDRLDLNKPWSFRNERDLRTLVQLASDKTCKDHNEIRKIGENAVDNFRGHDALMDVRKQVAMSVWCYNQLMN